MKLNNMLAMLAAGAAVAMPVSASAQFGGLVKQAVPGLGGGNSAASAGDADAFLANAMLSTKNVMIASALLSAAVQNRMDMAALKQQKDGIESIKSFKDATAKKAELVGNLEAMASRKDAAADFSQAYQSASAEQKKLIAEALVNLAIGVARNVALASQAPGMVSGMASNPANLRHLGEVKAAAELIGVQAKGFATIAPALPKVFSALKVKAPAASATSSFQPVSL
jgi:hypothetical protein